MEMFWGWLGVALFGVVVACQNGNRWLPYRVRYKLFTFGGYMIAAGLILAGSAVMFQEPWSTVAIPMDAAGTRNGWFVAIINSAKLLGPFWTGLLLIVVGYRTFRAFHASRT